jgi:folate-binding protein YgfZ
MTTINTSGITFQEYRAAKESAAVFDFSHWGRVKASGADTLDLLNRLSTNKVTGLKPGQGAPTILTSDKGRIVDLIYVYNLGPYVLLVTSPGAVKSVMEWVDKYTIMDDCTLEDVSQATSLLTITGPRAPEVVGKLANAADVPALTPCGSLSVTISGAEAGALRWPQGQIESFQLFIPSSAAEQAIQSAASAGATLAGIEAWDLLRLEAGVPAYDKELSERFNPLEAGLIEAIDFAKGCYIGQEVIARLDTYKKVQRRLVSLSFENGGVNEGSELLHDGQVVGEVTSAANLPGGYVGLGYVREAFIDSGSQLTVRDGGKATVLGLSQLFGAG